MPRDIPVGNGDLLVTFDEFYRVRDIYYPFVGKYNHSGGHVQRFGVWADGRFTWVEEPGWRRELRYRKGTLVTEVRLIHDQLGLELVCNDAVDFNEPIFFKHIAVRDLTGNKRDVRVFFHIDLSINESPVGDTANYDPETAGVVLYKEDSYFLVNACDENKCGIDHWSIGSKRVGGAEGTWRDAEDGQLGRNAISQGSVDATVGSNLRIEPHGTSHVTMWIACGTSYDQVRSLNRMIWTNGPEKLLERTEAYWKFWASKENAELDVLPERVADLFITSQLVMRTQVDNRGAIIAANDTDIAHAAGDHYSYCWPRDGALVAHALVLAGQSALCRNFFRYSAKTVHETGYFLHKYTPAGNLASSWHPWILDGRPVLPIQQDETALVLWALREHYERFRDVEFVKQVYEPLVVRPALWMLDYRDNNNLPRQSWDLWEERRGIHLFTVAATIGALEAAAKFAEDFGETDRARLFRTGRTEIAEAMKKHLWDPQSRLFARMAVPISENGAGSSRVTGYRLDMTRDSANYALFAFGALEPDHPMVESEMRSLMDRLWVKTDIGGCARYERDYYHQVEHDRTDDVAGNPWVICTLWHAQYAIARAKTRDDLEPAMRLLEWAADRALTSGVLAEQFHPYTGQPISVSPLTWSHATVVTTVLQYLAAWKRLAPRNGSAGGSGKAGSAARHEKPDYAATNAG